MLLVDTNVLVYAMDEQSARHEVSERWLLTSLAGRVPVIFPWIALIAFVRLTTNPALVSEPLAPADAVTVIEDWLASPAATLVEPGPRHLARVAGLLEQVGTGGNLVNDAHLAALASEHNATVISFDRDFGRFPGVKWREPSAR